MTTLGGCCGLAGNFGVEKGHYDVSVKVAEHDLLPAVAAHPDAIVLADGFSCRTQLAELAGTTAITLAGAAGVPVGHGRYGRPQRPNQTAAHVALAGEMPGRRAQLRTVDRCRSQRSPPRARECAEPAIEIACDESGFTGGNLTFPQAVFSPCEPPHLPRSGRGGDGSAEAPGVRSR